MATEPPFAARAALGLSNDDNAQEADFRLNTRCFGTLDSGYADKAELGKHVLNSGAEVDVYSKTRHKVEVTWNWKH